MQVFQVFVTYKKLHHFTTHLKKIYMLLKIGSNFLHFTRFEKPNLSKKKTVLGESSKTQKKTPCWTHICPSFFVGGENGPNFPTSTLLEKDDITPFFSGQKRPNIPAPLSSTSRVRMEAGNLS